MNNSVVIAGGMDGINGINGDSKNKIKWKQKKKLDARMT